MNKLKSLLFVFSLLLVISFTVSCKKEVEYKEVEYIVSFNTLGGSTISSISVKANEKITLPKNPNFGSNDFAGWYTDSEYNTAFDANAEITKDLVLYAKWERTLKIYTVNDFHGAIEDRAAQVGEYLISNRESNPENTLILSSGDMFQGTGISNLNYGLDVINIMNMIEFDAMSVGNHEFDWELSTILNYFDGSEENGEADFPLLGCNVIDKSTNTLPLNMKSHVVVEKGGLKIGIIGYIGGTLEDSIATNMVQNYEFVDPVSIVASISEDLRTNQGVDIVIASGHDASQNTNRELANLSGNEKIDAIVNGHTHVKSYGTIRRTSDNVKVPYVQAGSSGEAVGVIELKLDALNLDIENANAYNKNIMDTAKKNEQILTYVNQILEETSDYFDRVIGVSGKNLTIGECATWACNAILDYCNESFDYCDVAFTNLGGIRENAFPINKDEEITVGRVFKIMPFDNFIKISSINGKVLRTLLTLTNSELAYSSNSVEVIGASVYINGTLIDDEKYYKVAVVDYIFDKDSYPFNKGEDVIITGKLLRDILIENIEDATLNGNKCFLGKE